MKCPKCGTYIAELEKIYSAIGDKELEARGDAFDYPNDVMQQLIAAKDIDAIIEGCSRWYRFYGLMAAQTVLDKDNVVWKGKYPKEHCEEMGREDLI